MKKRFSEEQIIAILREAEVPGQREDVCRRHGVAEQTYYRWKKKYHGMSVDKVQRLKHVEAENAKLKRVDAEQALANQTLREIIEKRGGCERTP